MKNKGNVHSQADTFFEVYVVRKTTQEHNNIAVQQMTTEDFNIRSVFDCVDF